MFNNNRANRTGVPRIRGIGTGNRFQIPDTTPQSAQNLFEKITSRLNPDARSHLRPHIAQDAFGNHVMRVFNPGYTREGEDRQTVDFSMGHGGFIAGHNTANPSSIFAVTGMADVTKNQAFSNVSTLADLLNNAVGNGKSTRSIPAMMQKYAFPSLPVNSLTPQMQTKWGSSFLGMTGYETDAYGHKQPIQAQSSQIGAANFGSIQPMYSGRSAHFFNAATYVPNATVTGEGGMSLWEKAKRFKNMNVPNVPMELFPGQEAAQRQMSMRVGGQVDSGYQTRMGFAMFAGGGMAEGTQYMREGSGYLASDTFHTVRLDPNQTSQFKNIMGIQDEGLRNQAMAETFGYGQGSVFMHRDVRVNALGEGYNIHEGIHKRIPGLDIKGGSSLFSAIKNIQFDEQTNSLNIAISQYTDLTTGTSKWGKKAQIQGVGIGATNSPLDVHNTQGQSFGFQAVQAMPKPEAIAGIGINALRTTYSEDELKPMFMDYAQSNFRISGGRLVKSGQEGFDQANPLTRMAAGKIWANGGDTGNLTGRAGQIFAAMGAAHFNANMSVGFSTSQITQEQFDTMNKTFEHRGQQYQRFSNPRDLGKGWLEVDTADIYSTLNITERYQKSYSTGRKTFKGASLDNMAYSHPENYEVLQQIQKAQGGNAALNFRQVMRANNDPATRAKLEQRRSVVNYRDLNAGEIMAGIPLDHPDREMEFMRQLAQGEHGKSVVDFDGRLMPSPKEAIGRVTRDRRGQTVRTFGSAYFGALKSGIALQDAETLGIGVEAAQDLFQKSVNSAYTEADILANSAKVVQDSNAMTIKNTLGGPVGAMPLLEANEILVGKEDLYNMFGINSLPKGMRDKARANFDHMRSTMPDYFTVGYAMNPNVKPDFQVANLRPVLPEEYMQRPGAQELPEMSGGRHFLSQVLVKAFGKDFDGDQGEGWANGLYKATRKGLSAIRSRIKPTSVADINEMARLQLAEQETLMESMAYTGSRDYAAQAAAAVAPGGSGWKTQQQISEGFAGQQASQASIGPTYNTGMKLVQGARLAGDDEAAKAMGWIMQAGYQTATKEQVFDDVGFNRMRDIMQTGSYDWSTNENVRAGYIANTPNGREFVSFEKDVRKGEEYSKPQKAGQLPSRRFEGGHYEFAKHIVEGFAQLASSVGDEEYGAKIAPNLSVAMLPSSVRTPASQAILEKALTSSRQSGDWTTATNTFQELVGGRAGLLSSVFGQGTQRSAGMAAVAGATMSKAIGKGGAGSGRIGVNPDAANLAAIGEQAKANLDVKKTGMGSEKHLALASSTSPVINRHTQAIVQELAPAGLSPVQEVSSAIPENVSRKVEGPAFKIGQQSRNEYLAGRGGVYIGQKGSRMGAGNYGSMEGVLAPELISEIVQSSIQDMRESNPALRDVPFVMAGKRPEYTRANSGFEAIMLGTPENLSAFVAAGMQRDEFRERFAGIAGVHPDDLTHEQATRAIVAHEGGHVLAMRQQEAMGTSEDYLAMRERQDELHRQGKMPYSAIQAEQDADYFATGINASPQSRSAPQNQLTELRDVAKQMAGSMRQGATGKGRRIIGAKKPYQDSQARHRTAIGKQRANAAMEAEGIQSVQQATQAITGGNRSLTPEQVAAYDEAGIPEELRGGADSWGSGPAPSNVTISNFNRYVGTESNTVTNRNFAPTSRGMADDLDAFISSGDMSVLQGYQELIGNAGADALTPKQMKEYMRVSASQRKAAKAMDSYNIEASMEKGLSRGAQAVENILATSDNFAQMESIDDSKLRRNTNDVKAAFQAQLPDKYQVTGQALAKGAAGVGGLMGIEGTLKDFAESIKNVTEVTKEQHTAVKNLTKQYDAAEKVVADLTKLKSQGDVELTDKQEAVLQAAKGVISKNKDSLETIRGTMASIGMGEIGVRPDPMMQEEREQRLMEALNRGGIGGARSRSRAKAQGLYGTMGDPDDEGGLEYMNRRFTDEGSINTLGSMMRMGNRAGQLLHGMTHLSHNILNPIAANIREYGELQTSRGRMLGQAVSGSSYEDMMSSEAGDSLRRAGRTAIAQETASRQVYNTYAGAANAFGTRQFGMMQGIAQSVGSPALSAGVGMQAIGMGAYAAPVMGLVGLAAGTAWLSQASNDVDQLTQSQIELRRLAKNERESGTNVRSIGDATSNLLNNIVRGAGIVFNPEKVELADKQATADNLFGGDMYGVIPQLATQLRDGSQRDRQRDIGKLMGLTAAQAASVDYTNFAGSDKALGLSEEMKQSVFAFTQRYDTGATYSQHNLGLRRDKGMRDELTEYANLGIDVGASWLGIAAAGGNTLMSSSQVQDARKRYQGAWADAQSRGESQVQFNDRQNIQNANTISLNAALYENYGANGPELDPTTYDPRAGDSNYQRSRLGIEAYRVQSHRSNVRAYEKDGYDIRSGLKQYALIDDPTKLAVYQENEQFNMSLDRSMVARTGKGIGTAEMLKMNDTNQTQGDVFRNIVQGDQWTVSRLAKQLGNAGLQTIDTRTGLGALEYGSNSAVLAALKGSDKLGLLKGVTDADLAGGTAGIQRNMELKQRDMQMFQFQQGQMQRTLNYGLMAGGGTIGANGMVQGGSLNAVSQVFAQNGMTFNQGNGMTMWQLEDAGVNLNRQRQQFSINQSTQQMAMQWQQFGVSGQQWQENRDLQTRQFNYDTNFSRTQMNIDRGRTVTQQGWQREDWQYSRNMSELQFGMQMRDADRNIRYSRGRDRLDQMRQRDDSVILHAAQMGQGDKEKERMEEQQKWSEEQFNRDKDHFEQNVKFQKERMDLEKKHYEQGREFELKSLQMQQQAHTMQIQWMNAEWKMEDQRRLIDRQVQVLQINMANEAAIKQQQLQVEMNRSNDILNGIGQAQNVIMAQFNASLQTGIGLANALKAAMEDAANMSISGYTNSPDVPYISGNHTGSGGYANGGFTGYGDKYAARGAVHAGEYVVPQQGTPVIRGDNQESLAALKLIAAILERIEKNPAVVNAVINTNQQNVSMRNLNLTDLAHGTLH